MKAILGTLFVVALLFVAGCASGKATKTQDIVADDLQYKANKIDSKVVLVDPKNVDILTSKGSMTIVSSEGPTQEKCSINMASLVELIEGDPEIDGRRPGVVRLKADGALPGNVLCEGSCSTPTNCCTVILNGNE